jgi:hypothetical protein
MFSIAFSSLFGQDAVHRRLAHAEGVMGIPHPVGNNTQRSLMPRQPINPPLTRQQRRTAPTTLILRIG